MAVCVHCATPLPAGSQFCSQCGTPVPGRSPDEPTFSPPGREIYERLKEATQGKYEIIRELGRGGMAVVFLGYQKSLDRHVAIKVLLPLLGYDPEIVERFTREARTQGKLDHPNIIQVYEIYNEGGLTFFTVPYISGQNLRTYLLDNPQPPLEKVFRYLTQAADALAYAHRRGVVHRDVKPDNILIDTERDHVILTDFGIAKALTAEKTLTTPGDLLGTPQYMSPEQGEGRHDLDGRADQYSLGLIGYEMVAGKRPIQADTLAELMYKHRFEEPPSLDAVRPDAPRHLRDAIQRAIRKDRDQRFPTMDALLAALERPWEVDMAGEVEEDRTEPMPPPGSEATTLRVPTPPRTPAGDVEETAPETTEPEPGPEPLLTTPEPWAVSTEPWESPAEAAAGAEAAREPLLGETRRPGVPRALLYGGGTAVVAVVGVVAALFFFGPLRPPGATPPAEPVSSEEAGVTGAATGEQETPGAPTGAEAPTTEPAAGGEPGGAETVAQETAADQPSGRAVVGDSPPQVPGATRQLQNAANAAYRWRNAALAAGVAETALADLDTRLLEADRLMRAGQFGDALPAYSGLVQGYMGLAEAATPAQAAEEEQPPAAEEEQPQPAEDEAMRLAAEAARAQATTRQGAAWEAGAANLYRSEWQRLDATRGQAVQAFEDGRFDEALNLFENLIRDYQTLVDRANEEMGTRVAAARSEMRQQRQAALDAGAEQEAADRLAEADDLGRRAIARQNDGNYVAALPLFGQARDAYAQIARELAEAAAAAAEPEPEEEPAAVPAEVAIRELIEVFRQAFVAKDLERMAQEVYRAPIPRQDAEFFQTFFRAASDLQASASEGRVDIADDGSSALADIELATRYRHARTGASHDPTLRFRLRFASGPGGWRLVRAVRR